MKGAAPCLKYEPYDPDLLSLKNPTRPVSIEIDIENGGATRNIVDR